MKTAIVIAVAALAAALPLAAQTSSVTLQNQEPSVFWYAVDPRGLEDVSVGSRQLAERVGEYFAVDTEEFPFLPLAPDTPVTLTGLSQGTHLVVGFFLVEGEEDLPVRAFSVQVDQGGGDRFYALFSGPALLTIKRAAGRLAGLETTGGTFAAAMPAAEAAEEPQAPAESPAEQPLSGEVPAEQPVAEGALAAEAVAEELLTGQVAAEEPPAGEAVTKEAAVEEPAVEEALAEQPASMEPLADEAVGEPAAAEMPPVEEAVAQGAAVGAAVEEAAVEEAVAEQPVVADQPAQVAAFSPAYSPVVFTRETRAGFAVLPISKSLFWGEPGTRLDSVEGIVREGTLELTLQTQDGFAENVSYFFYVFAERTLGRENAVTFELLPLARGGRGALVLWQKPAAAGTGRASPVFVGTVTTWGRSCTVSLPLDELPGTALAAVGSSPSIDLSSCRYDARGAAFEEFYFTSLELADFPGAAAGPVTR